MTIATRPDGASVTATETVEADYWCADEPNRSVIATCAGTVADGDPIDTSIARMPRRSR